MIGPKTSIAARPFWVLLQNPGPAIPDGDGGSTQTWTDLVPSRLFARIVPATGKDLERVAAGTVLSTLSRLVSLPYHPQVTTQTRLSWTDLVGKAHVANVTGAQADERSVELELVCVEVVPVVAGDVLEVGDVMRWSGALVEALRVDDRDVLVSVKAIERQSDGTVKLVLENADAPPEIRQ